MPKLPPVTDQPTGTATLVPTRVPAGLYCDECGYNLCGLDPTSAEARCPECGQPFDDTSRSVSRIPWVHRKQVGRVRAFAQTVRMVLLEPQRLAAEMWRPGALSHRAARRFRAACVSLAAVSVVVVTVLLEGSPATFLLNFDAELPLPRLRYPLVSWEPFAWQVCGWPVVWFWFNRAASALRKTIVEPARQFPDPGRARSAADYTAAPLVLTPLVLAGGWVAAAAWHGVDGSTDRSHFPQAFSGPSSCCWSCGGWTGSRSSAAD